jgi:hypothetical protein
MGKVFKKVTKKVVKRLARFGVFLTAIGAITFFNRMATVETIGFLAEAVFGHVTARFGLYFYKSIAFCWVFEFLRDSVAVSSCFEGGFGQRH